MSGSSKKGPKGSKLQQRVSKVERKKRSTEARKQSQAQKAKFKKQPKKTDFASLTGNFSIDKGLINNQKLLMLSPVMRLDGLGLVHTLQETLDYKMSITPLSKSKADTDYVDLTGVTIPMLITGSFSEPKFAIDTDSALKEQLKIKLNAEKKRLQKKIDKELEKHADSLDEESQDKLKKESKRLENKLKKFF